MIHNRVLVTRYGGAGDMIMMEPAIEALYYKHKPAEIHLRTHPHYMDLHKFHPLVSKIIPGILTAGESAPGLGSDEKKPKGYDFFYNTTGTVEMNRGIHGMDSFAFSTGAPLLRRTPTLYLDPASKIKPADIVIHVPKKPRNNDFKNHNIYEMLVEYLRKENVEFTSIATIGEGGEVENGLQTFAGVIAGAKLFVGPDSAGAHIAAALNVPNVVAYTSDFPSKIRAYSNTIAVHDNDINTLLRTVAVTYSNLGKIRPTSNVLDYLSSRFVVGKKNEDSIIVQDLTLTPDWRNVLFGIKDKLPKGGRIFMYETHVKHGGFDSLMLVKFMVESLRLNIVEYSSFADINKRYFVVAEKV